MPLHVREDMGEFLKLAEMPFFGCVIKQPIKDHFVSCIGAKQVTYN